MITTHELSRLLGEASGADVEVYLNPANTHFFVHAPDEAALDHALDELPRVLGYRVEVDDRRFDDSIPDGRPWYAMVGVLRRRDDE